jgi:hypothetical protein
LCIFLTVCAFSLQSVVSILGKITICAFFSLSVDFPPQSVVSILGKLQSVHFPPVLSSHLQKSFVFAKNDFQRCKIWKFCLSLLYVYFTSYYTSKFCHFPLCLPMLFGRNMRSERSLFFIFYHITPLATYFLAVCGICVVCGSLCKIETPCPTTVILHSV